ncbi:MAG: hypothetical protein AB7L91_07590 [Dehalococcoidia bacterium]
MFLSAYLDGDLDTPERLALERRLVDDPSLHDAFEGLRDVVSELQQLDDLRAPRAFALPAATARPRVLWPLELGLRVGAVAAAAAFVVVLGLDVQRGGAGGVRGQAAPLRLQAESASSSFIAPDASAAGAVAASGAFRDATAGGDADASAAEDAVTEPDMVPTSFVTQPVTPATAPSLPAQPPDREETPAATPVPSRTPALAVTSASTTTSALQATPSARALTPAATAVASSTPALAQAAAPTTPAAAPTPAATMTPGPAGAPAAPSTATTVSTPQPAAAGGQGAAGSAPALPAVTPASPTGDEQPATEPPIQDDPVTETAPVPVAPAEERGGGGFDSDLAPDLGSIKPVPAQQPGGWGQSVTRVGVTRTDRFDGFRAAEFGLGGLALGLGSMTGWLWFARRRGAAASGF